MDRQVSAVDEVRSWGIAHVDERLACSTGGGRVAAVLLAESVRDLELAGVPRSKLLSKLRNDRDLWPTWAELRAGGMLARNVPPGTALRFEPRRKGGRHPDFLLEHDDGSTDGIEFKALGLSDQEVRFVASARHALPAFVPPVGICTLHTDHDTIPLPLDRAGRRRIFRDAEKAASNLPGKACDIAAAVLVAHGHERAYLARLRSRFEEAFSQLTAGDDTWVAFHWGNGAPLHQITEALAAVTTPPHLRGVILTGSVALLGSLEHFIVSLRTPFSVSEGGFLVHSKTGNDYAQTLLAAVDEASGIRPTLLRVPWEGQYHTLLEPDPSVRIQPFNTLLVPDPRAVRRRQTQIRDRPSPSSGPSGMRGP